ncbi:MAG: 2-oxoacid:ferredoxin oxidoreductase subunit beta [Bacteroidales bacterium]|nr:2-oxoacid:ferredoxin oxidoreductase subunit beta [Bacteroidales bacterium]
MIEEVKLSPKDFKSDQEVRWCAGCGDHAVLNAVHKSMADLNLPKEKYVVISGIGCSSRFPYYMNTYAMHSIHGRAAAISSGVKVANPDLNVWMITGDGDCMAIGGNHFIHVVRRNIDINILLLNNQIYGLTKGQYSPTSLEGQVTKTSPYGTIEPPFHPGELVIGAQGKFFARSIDNNVKLCAQIFTEAAQFKGTSVVEVLQNCVIYNDKAHGYLTDKAHKDDRQLILEHGKPMIYGKNQDKGIIIDGFQLKTVTIGENGITKDDILVHDAYTKNPIMHLMIANMSQPEFPVALGIIRQVQTDTYEEKLEQQIKQVQSKSSIKSMKDLLYSGNTWEV